MGFPIYILRVYNESMRRKVVVGVFQTPQDCHDHIPKIKDQGRFKLSFYAIDEVNGFGETPHQVSFDEVR